MMPLTDAFQPGEKFFDHYDLVTLEDPDFYPDGRDLGENYTYTLWRMNKCVKADKLDCLYCHTSSGRFIQKDDPNKACLECHKERAVDLTEHTHHPEEGPGNRCIDCHMPMTEFARMKRSDHSMLPPTPAATIAFGSPNACNICHSDQDAKWANRWVKKWHGSDYQESVLQRATLVDQARKQDWTRLEAMLTYIADPDGEEVVKNGLIRLLWSCEDERKWPVLVKALQDASPLVRASAADALRGHLTAETVGALLQATQDDLRLVRIRAAGALAALPAGSLDPAVKESLTRATRELEASLKTRPDDYSSHYNLGNFYMDRREYKKAIESYETSIGIRPGVLPPLVNAAFAHVALGDPQAAEASLKRGLEIDAESLAANLNLGMLLGEQGRVEEAESYFLQALKTDNNSDAAAYNLCVIAGQDKARVKEAISWCKKAAALRPEDPKYAYTLGYYQHQSGDDRSAVATLRGSVDKQTPHAGSYGLLGEIYQQQGKIKKALSLYNKALENPRLDRQAKGGFAQKIQMLSAQ
jgi:tetratricopeptide (TPR) repeat protein